MKADGSVDTNTYLTAYSETDPIVGAVNGIVKSNGSGTISAATGTDYLTPSGDGTDLTFNYQQAPHGSTVNISVTVASKTSAHRYQVREVETDMSLKEYNSISNLTPEELTDLI